jgi:Rps23 Pro-64 3,4-dihydroxylase Tpa1-like proline 4-hydroxylase
MGPAEPKVGGILVSGRQLFVCDNFIDPALVTEIAEFVKTLHYERKERARADLPPSAASAEITDAHLATIALFPHLRQIAGQVFPGERLVDQRAYVNSSVYGDLYHMHRDCSPDRNHVTILYYASPGWQPDWGGETIFFNDESDAEVVVSPKPGRIVVARGAILHRGNVPTRACYEARLTIAYKLLSE